MVTLVTRGIIFPLFGRVKTHLYRKIGTGCDLHRTKVLNDTDQNSVATHVCFSEHFVLGSIELLFANLNPQCKIEIMMLKIKEL